MLLLWGRRTVINIEIPSLEETIKVIKEDKKAEQKAIDFYSKTLEQAIEERDIVHAKFIEAKDQHLKDLLSAKNTEKSSQEKTNKQVSEEL